MSLPLQFKKSALKNVGIKYRESSLLVQSLKALGKEYINKDVIAKIFQRIPSERYEKILKDTKTSTVWIYEVIKEICQVDLWGTDG